MDQKRLMLAIAVSIAILLGFQFLVEFDRFRSGSALQPALLKLIGRVPVDQRFGDFLPFAAFGAEIAYAFAVNLILCYGLVRAVFQDEAAGLGESGNLGSTEEGRCKD